MTNCTLFANNCLPNPAVRWLDSSPASGRNKNPLAEPFARHDEQSDSRERRSWVPRQWQVTRRRPVIGNIRRELLPGQLSRDPPSGGRGAFAEDDDDKVREDDPLAGRASIGWHLLGVSAFALGAFLFLLTEGVVRLWWYADCYEAAELEVMQVRQIAFGRRKGALMIEGVLRPDGGRCVPDPAGSDGSCSATQCPACGMSTRCTVA